jgi:uncharacterized coiled-coil protein SlyX
MQQRMKMKKSMAKLTDLEVKFEYMNSVQDVTQLMAPPPEYAMPVNHDPKKEIAL